jgi:hypothetical protein
MIAAPERRKHARARRDVVCGRRNCGECTRWHHITDFSVTRWADWEKTTPKIWNSRCDGCVRERRRQRPKRRQDHRRSDPQHELKAAFARMSLQDRQEYQWEGGVPLSRWFPGEDEDFDAAPVPQGCPRCYLRDRGEVCITCPDIELRQRARRMGAVKAWKSLTSEA